MSRHSFGGRSRGKRGRDRFDPAGGGATHDRDDASTDGPLRQREAYMRMNFLFQAAHLTATGPAACLPLSRFYAATMRKIGSRLTIRSSPAVKSDSCKVCYSLLLPTPTPTAAAGSGSEAAVAAAGAVVDVRRLGSSVALQRGSSSAEPALVRSCRCCGTLRRVGLKRQKRRRATQAGADTSAGEQSKPTAASSTLPPASHSTATPLAPASADAMR